MGSVVGWLVILGIFSSVRKSVGGSLQATTKTVVPIHVVLQRSGEN